jgi:hypothetical protein
MTVDMGFNDSFVNGMNTEEIIVTNEVAYSKLSQIAENDIEMNNLKK